MNTCPGLSNTSHEVKTSLYRLLGGHPETLLLASGWVKAGHNPNTLLENPPINERDTQNWAAYFARDLLHHLDPGERQILETAAVLTRPFTAQQLSALTSISDHYAAPILNKWTNLGMVEPILGRGEPRYRFHILMQNAVLDRLTPNDLRALHQRAATYYGGPFVDEARRQALIRSGTVWSDSRVAWLARDSNGILGLWLRRESDPELQRQILARALTWYHHLLEAGALKEASQIAQTLAPMLDQQGQRDLSRLLLQQSLIADDVVQRAENLGTLAKLRLQDGHLQSALEVYEEVVASLSGNMTQAQQAYILIRAGKIRQQMGEHGEAIDHYQRALNLMREEKNNEGEAQALHSLSTIYRETGNARQALVYSQAAMECYQSLDHQQGLTLVYYEQGLILKALSRYESALDRFTKSLEIARQLSDRLGIASTLMQIGEIFQRLDQDNRAIRALEESANHYARLQNPKEQEVLSRLEFIYAQQERFDQAVSQFREAKKRPRANGSGIGIETGDAPVDSEFNAG
jgi:tetratricopeptide (TPR) repeat protein